MNNMIMGERMRKKESRPINVGMLFWAFVSANVLIVGGIGLMTLLARIIQDATQSSLESGAISIILTLMFIFVLTILSYVVTTRKQ